MKRIVALLAASAALALPSGAGAIVHLTTPIACVGAVAASGGKAGGAEAFDQQAANRAPGPPMPAQGLAHAGEHACS